uniref:DUF834 domain-containing protein n=1 Tax=Oryza glumipatula TaxID=40148 RepID=A0A0D9Z414_9ORYZ
MDDDGCHGASQGAAAVGTARHKRGKDGAVSVLEPAAGMAMAAGAKAAAVVPTRRRRDARRRSPSDLRLLAGSGGWPAVV